jgi:hypothetical protein
MKHMTAKNTSAVAAAFIVSVILVECRNKRAALYAHNKIVGTVWICYIVAI